jgi:UPF0755 protein
MAREKKSDTTYWDTSRVREAQQETEQKPKKKKKKKRNFLRVPVYLLCVILVSALLAGIGWLLANDLCSLNKPPVSTTIVVEEGDSVSDVAQKLKDAGLINYKPFFLLVSKFLHAEEIIEPGTYENINSDMDYRALVQSLHNYQTFESVKVTIPEGKTVREIFDILEENGVAKRTDLEEAAANADYPEHSYLDPAKLGSFTRVEGYLFPDTYEFYLNSDAEKVLDTMMNNFENRITGQIRTDIDASGYSLQEIIIAASIIEKESNDNDEERANISSVLYNRLKTTGSETYGMLQMDSTIDYALALDGKDRSEFSTDYVSPYNTYTFAGFPAGPICNPGLKAIAAAIHPNETGYYYFAAGKDGVSHFFTNLADHNVFINSDMYKPS